MKFKIIFKEFTDSLMKDEKEKFMKLCDEFEKKDLSIIIGGAIRKEAVSLKGIATIDGKAGIIDTKIFVITVSIGQKNILQHESDADKPEQIVQYMEDFLKNYDIRVVVS
jgi:hypothetical protein